MKQTLILWTSAAIITFLAGFMQNRTSPGYPASGTIGIDGQKVSYLLKKVHRDNNDYVLMIRTDVKDLHGIIRWRQIDENQDWKIDTIKYSGANPTVTIPKQKAFTTIEYRLLLSYNNNEYYIPKYKPQKILFLGAVPLSISIHYYLTLFAGILLAMRAGLEFFSDKPRLRLYSIFTLISFFSCAMIFAPVKKAYEMGAIGRIVPPMEKLFEWWLIASVLIWIANLILISYTSNPRKWVLIFAIMTLLLFFSQNFV
jgi:hypothetical protein